LLKANLDDGLKKVPPARLTAWFEPQQGAALQYQYNKKAAGIFLPAAF
jgi:hypothetical protein